MEVMKRLVFFLSLTTLILSGIFIVRFKLRNKNVIIKEEMTTREPAFAGQFYPANKDQLQKEVNQHLANSKKIISRQEEVNILIVPHAGYRFSGSVAGAGYKQVQGQNINRVILIGSSHQSYFDGAAVDNRNSWKTPLGAVETDQQLITQLCEDNQNIKCIPQPHNQEHSLEVQIPFLQTVLDNFKIVPILLGQTNNETIEQLTNILQQQLTPNTLILISTDLSHYPNYEIANQADNQTIKSILSGDPDKFDQTINNLMAEGYPNLQTCACAKQAVKIGLKISQELEGRWREISYANSGDITGDKSRVVGYAALAFSQENDSQPEADASLPLNTNQKQKLLDIARKTLEQYLASGEKPNFDINDPDLKLKYGVFVTLNKNKQLRGCMGNFKPDTPLWQTVQDQAVTAAINDPRFPKVSAEELKDIEVEISVLSQPQEIDDWQKIELGTHGVIVQKGNRSGTYLPQVGTEQDWADKEEFLSHLCANKAGLAPKCYEDSDTDLLIYTAEVFSEGQLTTDH